MQAEVQFYSFLELAAPLANNVNSVHTVEDVWGNGVQFSYDDQVTVSWAFKVDQMGFHKDGPKYADIDDSSTSFVLGGVHSSTLTGRTNPFRRGVGAPYQSSLGRFGSKLPNLC